MTERTFLRDAFSRILIQRDLQTSRYAKVRLSDFIGARATKPRGTR